MKADIADDRAVVRLAKRQADGEDVGFQKTDWMKLIYARGKDLYGDTLHPAQSFTKVITEDPIGRELYRAKKAAPGLEIDPRDPSARGSGTGSASTDDPDPEQTPEERIASLAGPNHLKMHFLAIDQQRFANTSYPQAYSHVYSDRNNRDLRDRVHREHIANALGRAG